MSAPFAEWPEVLTVADVRDCLGLAHNEAYRLFKAPGFPLIEPGKRQCKRVGKYALRRWINKEAKDGQA